MFETKGGEERGDINKNGPLLRSKSSPTRLQWSIQNLDNLELS